MRIVLVTKSVVWWQRSQRAVRRYRSSASFTCPFIGRLELGTPTKALFLHQLRSCGDRSAESALFESERGKLRGKIGGARETESFISGDSRFSVVPLLLWSAYYQYSYDLLSAAKVFARMALWSK